MLGTAFGAAVFGAVLGPVFGAVAHYVGVRPSFVTLGLVALVFAVLASRAQSDRGEKLSFAGVRRAFHDVRFVGGLWLNTLPAMLFGMLMVLAPLALAEPAGRPSRSRWSSSSRSRSSRWSTRSSAA